MTVVRAAGIVLTIAAENSFLQQKTERKIRSVSFGDPFEVKGELFTSSNVTVLLWPL